MCWHTERQQVRENAGRGGEERDDNYPRGTRSRVEVHFVNKISRSRTGMYYVWATVLSRSEGCGRRDTCRAVSTFEPRLVHKRGEVDRQQPFLGKQFPQKRMVEALTRTAVNTSHVPPYKHRVSRCQSAFIKMTPIACIDCRKIRVSSHAMPGCSPSHSTLVHQV